jgi:hypothetical protein
MFLIATLLSLTVANGLLSQTATIYQTATRRLKQIRGKMRKVAGELTDLCARAEQLEETAQVDLAAKTPLQAGERGVFRLASEQQEDDNNSVAFQSDACEHRPYASRNRPRETS